MGPRRVAVEAPGVRGGSAHRARTRTLTGPQGAQGGVRHAGCRPAGSRSRQSHRSLNRSLNRLLVGRIKPRGRISVDHDIRPLITLIGAALASLAFAFTASATPSMPIMHPIPKYACGNVTAAWTPSMPDPGGMILGYGLNLADLTAGTKVDLSTTGLSIPLPGLVANHKYVVRVRACSTSTARSSLAAVGARIPEDVPVHRPVKRVNEYIEYNPGSAGPRPARWPEHQGPRHPERPAAGGRALPGHRVRARRRNQLQVTGSHQRRGAISSHLLRAVALRRIAVQRRRILQQRGGRRPEVLDALRSP